MASKRSKKPTYKTRHRFFLNPYQEHAFTRCPRCEGKTKVRKFPLVFHVEPQQMVILNKSCRYCQTCDLIIARQSELEPLLAASLEQAHPELIGNEYLVVGVLERKDWRAGHEGKATASHIVDRLFIFEEVLDVKVEPGGWYPPQDRRQ